MTVEPKSAIPSELAAARVEQGTKPSWRGVAWLALLVCGLLAMVYLSPLREYLDHLRFEVSEQIRSLGLLGPGVFTFTVALLVGVGFPRLLFCVIAGMALGFWSGLLWAQLGTLLGNYAVFLVASTTGRAWAQDYLEKRSRWQGLIREESTWGVILARQIPVPGVVINLACGLFGLRHRHFLLGTLIGQLPEAIPFTMIGAGTLEPSFAKSAGLLSLAVAVAVVVGVGLRHFLRVRRPSADPARQGD